MYGMWGVWLLLLGCVPGRAQIRAYEYTFTAFRPDRLSTWEEVEDHLGKGFRVACGQPTDEVFMVWRVRAKSVTAFRRGHRRARQDGWGVAMPQLRDPRAPCGQVNERTVQGERLGHTLACEADRLGVPEQVPFLGHPHPLEHLLSLGGKNLRFQGSRLRMTGPQCRLEHGYPLQVGPVPPPPYVKLASP